MKKTVVQKITENYKQMDYIHFGAWLEENIQPLLDEEKEQLKDAALFDFTERPQFKALFVSGFEKYFNKTYKTVSK
jgi:predicted ATPase